MEAFSSHQMLEYLLDKLNPSDRQAITIDDFITYPDQLLDSGNFFNGLGNINRYLLHEERSLEDVKTRQESFLCIDRAGRKLNDSDHQGLNDWDRFVHLLHQRQPKF